MIDPQILMEILKFRFSLHMVKDDWPPKYCLKFWSLDLVCKWSKIIDPHLSLLSLQNSTGNFKV